MAEQTGGPGVVKNKRFALGEGRHAVALPFLRLRSIVRNRDEHGPLATFLQPIGRRREQERVCFRSRPARKAALNFSRQ